MNLQGLKWNKGGALSRKKMITLDFSAFSAYAEKLENLGANLEKIFSDVMEEAAEKIQDETLQALENQYLPAKGKYRGKNSDTKASVIRDVKPKRSGATLEVKLGFDKTKPGAGGFLITGTPKMQPDAKLAVIYEGKVYQRNIQRKIEERLQKEIDKTMGSK